ncbi:hypothetical protein QR680_008394 [Steinernema hermaphroditum]|uniref:Granulins domain-containing protein n=1 Tax=Steinernema hermaphroditum TaxID=289476 RepID=A0AA39IIP8_9BILA|nr:hypothetical protein QR680_008394 [Steinernema hermaphroditum]
MVAPRLRLFYICMFATLALTLFSGVSLSDDGCEGIGTPCGKQCCSSGDVCCNNSDCCTGTQVCENGICHY